MKKVFILGNPRSGTSLLRLMLNVHSNIISPPESGFLHWWFGKYKNWSWNEISKDQLDNFIQDLSSSKKIETWNLNYSQLKEYLIINKPESYSKLGELIYLFYANSLKKYPKIIVDKNNYYINHLDDLKKIWGDAYFIFLIRDGRDVACSYIDIKNIETTSPYKPILTDKIEKIAMEWSSNNENILQFLSKMSNNRYLIVKFEEVILHTEYKLNEVCNFLDVDFEYNMLNYYKLENHNEPDLTIDWKKKTLIPPDIKSIGRYKINLNTDDIRKFNVIARDTILKFNYEV